jgi:molybdate transport system substrate-binding protein
MRSPRARSLRTLALALCALSPWLASCGGGDDKPELTVSAASSLTAAFTEYGGAFTQADTQFSFGGSDELAAQIREGARPDVFASANTDLPDELHRSGLVEKPVEFATNRLVIAVPADEAAIGSVEDLAEPGVTIAIGSPTVPIGSYTREVLGRLPKAMRSRILGNVRSEEPDVAGIVGKLTQGAVDAGFVYVTDVEATEGELEAIDLGSRLQPSVTYGVALVEGTEHPDQAQSFVDGLLHGEGRAALRQAGFGPPPG